jgi:hypothetical protein
VFHCFDFIQAKLGFGTSTSDGGFAAGVLAVAGLAVRVLSVMAGLVLTGVMGEVVPPRHDGLATGAAGKVTYCIGV